VSHNNQGKNPLIEKTLKASLLFLSVCLPTSAIGTPVTTGGGAVYNPDSCTAQIRQAEQRYGIPNHLLLAIAKIESGRKDKHGNFNPWPWTINVEGKGYIYNSKAQAISAVQNFKEMGKSSIDVGCMQVNLAYHPHAFSSVHNGFDPHQNVDYAARFLKGLHDTHGSWEMAVAHYHSATPKYHIPYRQKVLALWGREKGVGTLGSGNMLAFRDRPKSPAIAGRLQRLKTLAARKKSSLYGQVPTTGIHLAYNGAPRTTRHTPAKVTPTEPSPEPQIIAAAASLPAIEPEDRIVRGKVIKRQRMHAGHNPRPGQITVRTASRKSTLKKVAAR